MSYHNTRRRLRIAMVGSRGVPAGYSGIERAIEEIGSRLVTQGHEVTVFCMARRYDTHPALYRGIKLRHLPSVTGKHSEMLVHAALSTLVGTFGKFDVIHFHACGPSLFVGIPRLFGKATLATLHGQDWRASKWGRLTSLGLRLGEWSACYLASKATCVSMASRDDLKQRLGCDIECVPNGVLPVSRRPMDGAAARFGLVPGGYVTFVGRLTKNKNVHHLIEAFRGIGTSKKLVIVGGDTADPAYVHYLRSLAAGDDRIIFTGLVIGETLAELCSNAGLFCLPTAHEGMSVALLEALAYGVPVLVSDIPANLEVIEGTGERCGLVFEVGSVQCLREKLSAALASPASLEPFRLRGPSLVAARVLVGSSGPSTRGNL